MRTLEPAVKERSLAQSSLSQKNCKDVFLVVQAPGGKRMELVMLTSEFPGRRKAFYWIWAFMVQIFLSGAPSPPCS